MEPPAQAAHAADHRPWVWCIQGRKCVQEELDATSYTGGAMSNRQLVLLLTCTCLGGGCAWSENPELSSETEAKIAQEVRATFQDMSDAIIALDLDQALALFDESAPPVHSVDGQMFVGLAEIEPAYRNGMALVAAFNRVDVVQEELKVLGPNAASYVVSFDESFRTVDGETLEIQGVWTLVFHRTADGWRIVHSAASHGR